MSPTVGSCILCGWMIVDYPGAVSWVNQFRALVPHPSTGDIVLTGLGIHGDPYDSLLAPLDRDSRGDQPGFENRNGDLANDFRQVYLQTKSDVIFHDACWSLLMRYMPLDHSTQMLQRLYDVCRSLPYPLRGTTLSWGHDYGGLVIVHKNEHYPWEDYYEDRDFQAPDETYAADPLETTEAQSILSSVLASPERSISPAFRSNPAPFPRDLFFMLPLETRCQIASYLSTLDFLNARLASRAISPVFHLQAFWKTRFDPGRERAWLFELCNNNHTIMDHRSIYYRTQNHKLGPHLRNRERIWKLFRRLPCYVNRRWMEPPKFSTSTSLTRQASAWLRPEPRPLFPHGFEEGCRISHLRAISIEMSIDTITAHFITFDDATYIAGFEFNHGDQKLGCGYQSFHVESTSQNISLGYKLHGMLLAVGSRGIRAVKFIGPDDKTTQWLGDPNDCPQTERLVFDCTIDVIETGFDGCKLNCLRAIEATNSPANLRTSAYWYPHIPPPSLSLNEQLFPQKKRFMTEYKPLFWVHFGASERLRCLTSMRVTYSGSVDRIEFTYDSFEPLALGRFESRSKTPFVDFSIDGAHGEIINRIEVFYIPDTERSASVGSPEDSSPLDGSQFVTFKAHTSRGRSKLFLPESKRLPQMTKSCSITIEQGTTITGLYAQQQRDFGRGLTALGVISE